MQMRPFAKRMSEMLYFVGVHVNLILCRKKYRLAKNWARLGEVKYITLILMQGRGTNTYSER